MNQVLSLCALLATFALPAFAQEAVPLDDATAAAPTAIEDQTATDAEWRMEEDLSLFWGNLREVEVVQRRLYLKDGRLELTPYVGIIPNDDFLTYYPMGMRAGYHFSEAFSIEASYAYSLDVPSDLGKFLEGDKVGLTAAKIMEYVHMYYNIDVLWAPIYGKFSLMGLKLTHFDTYFGIGAGLFHTTEYPKNNPDGNPKVKPAGNTIVGFRWFINKTFNLHTEYRHYFFQKIEDVGGISKPVEISFGLGLMLF
ncbi:outer membrane beta-barrel domain-containing protein [Myxococcota bacterium]|nr:outer membrane beta-barrel domain-containing protein [Myxococcota bacterium]MBU1899178.1 outer membrane beta-barrel domain-containing protein [Myxococcota bacterium]